jgi:hypothetical protein
MVSSESERVALTAPVYTKQAAGRVEIWLLQVRWCIAATPAPPRPAPPRPAPPRLAPPRPGPPHPLPLSPLAIRPLFFGFACVQLEQGMRTTLHALTKNCIDDSTSNKVQRPKWIDSWPSQIVLAVNQLFWTREVELAIKQSHTAGSFASLTMTPKGVHALLDKLNSQVRSAGGRSKEAGLFFSCV